ncbi:ASCH domain-containing protein [Opitutus terrae]|uniref:ASCH domain-containing protein n=1 Tax=Opitutus terrae (strain DSM 11246 / JCM 15787 / PB90-1) TaxID=452637 RepID=B1ZQF9_OPITP|nr:protein of unknown function DUF437 [Opitutus terrae PB90-1]
MNKVLLLSIRPEFSEKIFSGKKRVELRRLRPSVEAGDLVLVYTSSPQCELTGAFVVTEVQSATPDELWDKVRRACALSRRQFDDYYRGSKRAYGIRIGRAWRLDRPLKLACMRKRSERFHPPQSYRYLAPNELGTLMPTLTARGLLLAQKREHSAARRQSVIS